MKPVDYATAVVGIIISLLIWCAVFWAACHVFHKFFEK